MKKEQIIKSINAKTNSAKKDLASVNALLKSAEERKKDAEKKLSELGVQADIEEFKALRNDIRNVQDEIDLYSMKIANMKKADDKTKASFDTDRKELFRSLEDADRERAKDIKKHCLAIIKLFDDSKSEQTAANSVLDTYGKAIGININDITMRLYNGVTDKTMILAIRNQAINTSKCIKDDGEITLPTI